MAYQPGQISANWYNQTMQEVDQREATNYARNRLETQDAISNKAYQQEQAQQAAKMAMEALAGGADPNQVSGFLTEVGNDIGVPFDANSHMPILQGRANQLRGGGNKVYGSQVYGTDEAGNPVLMLSDDQGNLLRPALPEGVKGITTPQKFLNLGDSIQAVDPRNPSAAPGPSFAVRPSPTETPEYKADVVEAQETAKSAVKKQKTFPKIRGMIQSEEAQHKFVNETILDAIELAKTAAGYGDLLTWVKSSDYKTLEQTLGTIKANISFGKLQEMRNNSPTGGALGSISDQENKRLEAVAGSLDQGLKPEVLIRNLERVASLREEILNNMRSGFSEDYAEFLQSGGEVPAQQPAPQRNIDAEYEVDNGRPR